MRLIKLAAFTGLLAGTASAATAADLPRKILPPAPVLQDTETWYLRGDVGIVHHKRPEADFGAGALAGSMGRENIANTALIGVGVGYRFSPMFRADLTLDHRFGTVFRGVGAGFADKGLFESSTLLANGYWDIGTYFGFTPFGLTPYVGVGLGVAHNVMSQYSRSGVGRIGGDDDYSFAWALMAGVGYKLSSNFTLDVGYRYASLGDVKTRYYAAGLGSDVEAIGAHEVRVGVRYTLP